MSKASADLTILYDGTCGFCTRQARFARRLAGEERVQMLSTADPAVLERYPGLTAQSTNRQMHVHDEASGRRYAGAAAVARIVRAIPVIGPVGRLYYVPGLRHTADALYGLVARNRHRLSRWLGWQSQPDDSCADGACALPAPGALSDAADAADAASPAGSATPVTSSAASSR